MATTVTNDAALEAIGKDRCLWMLRRMLLIRHFENKVMDFFKRDLVRGSTHVYTGEEAIAVGVCAHLEERDYITSTHRGHGHVIAKGLSVDRMLAELMGKVDGYCHGKGGSMHIADLDRGVLGANGIVGGGIPIAVGAGLTAKLKRADWVVVCFFSDGAANQGAFLESLNLAALWQVPVIFVCENNQYAMTCPVRRGCAGPQISTRAEALGIPACTLDGNDIVQVYEEAGRAIARARSGGGPSLIEGLTYRIGGHFVGDSENYRTREEVQTWMARCPIKRFRERLESAGIISPEEYERLDRACAQEIAEGEAFALQSPLPRIDDLLRDIYTEH